RLRVFRRRVRAVEEVRAGQDGHDAFLDAVVEAARLAALRIELHGAGEVFRSHRATEGLARDAGEDLLGAGPLLADRLRVAGEDLFAAGRVAHAAGIVGAADGHVADARTTADALDQEAHAVHRIEAVQGLDL